MLRRSSCPDTLVFYKTIKPCMETFILVMSGISATFLFIQFWKFFVIFEIRSNLRRNKFHKTNKAPIFLEVVLATEIMKETQSNLEEKNNLSILKDGFSPRTDPSIFTLTAPVLLDRSNKTKFNFPASKSEFFVENTCYRRLYK